MRGLLYTTFLFNHSATEESINKQELPVSSGIIIAFLFSNPLILTVPPTEKAFIACNDRISVPPKVSNYSSF